MCELGAIATGSISIGWTGAGRVCAGSMFHATARILVSLATATGVSLALLLPFFSCPFISEVTYMPLFSYIRQAFSRPSRTELAPAQRFVAVGDIHGRADLLDLMVETIANDIGGDIPLVFVGDYVDRGDDSAQVLGLLRSLQNGLWPAEVICLKGNHEVMMLDFLAAPEQNGAFWLANGGMHTLASFKIVPPAPSAPPKEMHAARDRLAYVLGPDVEAWLHNLPLSYQTGNVFVAHAGADPHRPVGAQDADTLLWGHPEFLNAGRRDGSWIVHGHTVVEVACVCDGRISVDTGAYATGMLSAAVIAENKCSFLTAGR